MSKQKRLRPLEPLERDYYDTGTESWGGGRVEESDESSDDEIQAEMRRIAELPPQIKRGPEQRRSEARQAMVDYEADMDNALDAAFADATRAWLPHGSTMDVDQKPSKLVPSTSRIAPPGAGCSSKEAASPKKDVKGEGKAKKEEEEVDPALGLREDLEGSDEEFAANEGLNDPTTAENDALFYDPKADDGDSDWVAERRKGRTQSDAVLNCPACMSLLTRDCQRHSEFKTQYRAMFVENCRIDSESRVFCPSAPAKKASKRAKRAHNSGNPDETMEDLKPNTVISASEPIPAHYKASDFFHPVMCEVCETQVGFCDDEELYHFNNVLASYT